MAHITRTAHLVAVTIGVALLLVLPTAGCGGDAAGGAVAVRAAPMSSRPATAVEVAAVASPVTTRFVAVGPERVADSRTDRSLLVPVDPTTWRLALGGRATVPSDAVAVSLHVTVTDAMADGWLSARPAGAAPLPAGGPTSTVNWSAGQTVSNAAVVALGPGTSVDLVAAVDRGAFSVVVDLSGVFLPASQAAGGRFVPAEPVRVLDTRLRSAPLPPGGSVTVPLPAGAAADTSALALNLTAITSARGYWTAHPAGVVAPLVSQLSSDGSAPVRAAFVIVAATTGGVSVTSSTGGHLVVDLLGSFTGATSPSSRDGLFVPMWPVRVLDTRFGPSPQTTRTPVWSGGAIEFDPLPSGSTESDAVLVNLTSTAPHGAGFVTAWAAGTVRPATSTLDSPGPGRFATLANLAILRRSSRGIALGSSGGEHLVADLAGWFTGIPQDAVLPPVANPVPDPDQDGIATPFDSCPSAPGPVDPFHRGCPTPPPSTQTFGASGDGRPLVVERRMGSAFPTRRLLVVGVIHGDETAGLRVLAALRSAPLPIDLDLWLVDELNPDGVRRGQRGNAAGVDLNRNFPVDWLPYGASPWTVGGYDPGPAPASEPETRAFLTLAIAIVATHGPLDAVLWYHQPWDAVVCSPGDDACGTFASRVGMAAIDEPRPGSAKTWSTVALGASGSAVIELPDGVPTGAVVTAHADAVRRYGTL